MKLYSKKWKFCAAVFAAAAMTGCSVMADEDMAAPDAESGGNAWTQVTAASDMTKLEDGLSVVRFDGDDGFAAFLENGGASSDSEVVDYLMENGLADDIGFSFPDLFGCSAISVTAENGERMFGRNFDWYNCDALILENHPEGAYASLSTVNTNFITDSVGTIASFLLDDTVLTQAAIYAPLDGMNERGLAVSVNMIEDSDTIAQDTEKPDITTTTAVRLLLNEAADVEEALELLGSYDLHASFGYMVHLAVSDASGRSVAVEYVNNEMIVTETPVVTNHYLAEGEKNGIGTRQSHTRFSILEEYLSESSAASMADVAGALEQVSKHNFNDGETTEWSAVFNQSTGEALYFHREDYGTGYCIILE